MLGQIVIFTLLVALIIPNAFAETEKTETSQNNVFGFQPGFLLFDEDLDDLSCDDIDPKPIVKTGRSLNIDQMDGYFFIIVGKTDFGEYSYLQIPLPEGKAGFTKSYLLDFNNSGKIIKAGLYQDYSQLAAYMETDKEPKEFDYKNYERFLTGQSKKVTPSSTSLGPGDYDMHAILFLSDQESWIKDEACAISLHWPITVDSVGYVSAKNPQTIVGRIYEIDEELANSLRDNEQEKTTQVLTSGGNLAIGILGKTIEDQSHVGSVAIYNINTNSIVKTINNPEGVVHGQFGQYILYKDDKLIVSAPWKNDREKNPEGAIYVFDLKTGNHLYTIKNPERYGPDEFGISLASVDDKLVVGAPAQEFRGVRSAGIAYIFNLDSGDLVATIENPSPTRGSNFGISVASLGENFLVGSPGRDVDQTARAGTVSIVNANTGSIIKTLENPEPNEGDQFGYSLQSDGSLILVGAPSKTIEGENGAGEVYLIDSKTGSVIREIPNPEPDENAHFGMSLLMKENRIFVGAPGAGLYEAGAVYVFDKNSGSLVETINNPNRDRLLNSLLSNEFGFSLAYSDGKLAIGDQEKTVDGIDSAGSVYVYDAVTFSLLQTIPNPSPIQPDMFGYSLVFVGDVEVSENTEIKNTFPELSFDDIDLSEPETKTQFNVGTVRWIQNSSSPSGYGIIEIVDPDKNELVDLIDIFSIPVYSTTDKHGIELAMVETGENTGVFYGDLSFTLNDTSTSLLKVSSEDTVTAEYLDTTLPSDFSEKQLVLSDNLSIIEEKALTLQENKKLSIYDQDTCEILLWKWVSPNTCQINIDFGLSSGIDLTIQENIKLEILSSVTLENLGTVNNLGEIQNDGIIDNQEGTINNNQGRITNNGSIENNGGSLDNNWGIIVNNDHINVGSYGTLYNHGMIQNMGSIWGGDPESIKYIMAPLKQSDIGVPIDEILCKDGLVLIQKHDGSPACVTPETKNGLIKRGFN